ncbi:MAG: DUF6094 domain-containing protein [Nanopusillaceae archaeon]
MRLIAQAKAGYYPTPPQTLALLEAALERAALLRGWTGGAALDPCAGEGEAIARVAQAARMKPYAVELDEARAAACASRLAPLEGRTVAGDAFRYLGEGFSLLWLNPPYDWDGEGRRLELLFLEHWLPALEAGGLLFLLIPQSVLEEAWSLLRASLEWARVYRLPAGEGEAFNQVLLVGAKSRYPYTTLEPKPRIRPPEGLSEELPHLLASAPSPKGRPRLRALEAQDPAALQALSRLSPLWKEVETSASAMGFRPLLPLKPAHLALLVAGGYMDLLEVEIEGDPHLVVGRVRKEKVVAETDEEIREQERFTVGLSALNLRTGELLEVE